MKLLSRLNILASLKNSKLYNINFFKKPLVIYKGNKGIMSCGYINMDVADKLGDCVATFSNINSLEDMFESNVVNCTNEAKKIGIKEGMSGKEVFKLINS